MDTPKRIPASDKRSRQLLLRLTGDEFDVLDAAAHLHRATPNAYAYELVKAHLARLSTDEFVQADLRNRRQFEEGRASTLLLRPASGAAAFDSEADTEADGQT